MVGPLCVKVNGNGTMGKVNRSGLLSSFRKRVGYRVNAMIKSARSRLQVRRVHGPAAFAHDDSPVVVCLIRNGLYYLDVFFEHHRALGARHFVFIDNGSTDGTVERIAAEPGTAILKSTLPAGEFENGLRETAARRYAAGRWCLFVDSDELFDFEGSEKIGLAGLTGYLDARGHTGLAAQMLEMFPKGALLDHAHLSYRDTMTSFKYYDISNIRSVPYDSPLVPFSSLLATNTQASERLALFYDGIRERIFNEPCCCLTKHPLVKVKGPVVPGRHPHCSTHLQVSDVTGVIRHYKFAGDFITRDIVAVNDKTWSHGEDKLRVKQFQMEPNLTLHSDNAHRYDGVSELLDAGFLLGSDKYSKWISEDG